ncbi:Ribonuclease H domain [Sesbania bispinosa]|nr:Ribonuclease H domain [Sesbania bispinosa]
MDRPNNVQILQNVRRLGLDIVSTLPNIASHQPRRLVAWVPPPHMNYALNTDDSSFGNPGNAGIGGIFRDATGTWVLGYFSSIGVSNIVEAELKAILFGLQIAWDRKYMRIKCYTDSTHAIDLISKDLLSKGWSATITHLLREGNEVADSLAKKGAAGGDTNLQILETPFAELNSFLLVDALGIQHLRL